MSYKSVIGDKKYYCDTDVEKADEIKDGQSDKTGDKAEKMGEKEETVKKDDEAGDVEGIEIEVEMEVEGTAAMKGEGTAEMEVEGTTGLAADDRDEVWLIKVFHSDLWA